MQKHKHIKYTKLSPIMSKTIPSPVESPVDAAPVSERHCCDGKETSLLDLFQVAGGSVSSGMEIGGEAVVAGCCGEELLLLWCSLEAGVDGLPSLLLVVGLAAGAGGCSAAEEGNTCWGKASV
jgi:hypothetical protein